ncbi:aldolase/citrate lyase family protein [Pseudomonas citronellolis]|uniref:HpcH/HpaI aldolase/citrate lyase family protein n=1 Tax=Pseudomonas citronellolis TaxID=53408 RepID=UPI002649E45E|nr:aldolase/citrate lyase family protein [Pseudomonas citronellolis]MDN6875424.1 aldolase/citrate lyase family protein [Pseudomonas citronellolis]
MNRVTKTRSILFTPALRVDRFHKGLTSGVDISLIDLEDSVALSNKQDAREALLECLQLQCATQAQVAVRINSIDSGEGYNDLMYLRKTQRSPDILLVPKVESSRDIAIVDALTAPYSANHRYFALIENTKGVDNIAEIAANSPKLAGLIFGSADYTRSIGANICWETLLFARMAIVHAARSCHAQAIDTPYFDINDLNGLREDCLRVKKLGFNGRCVIHPSQTQIINTVFSPSEEELVRARRIVDAAQKSEGNICRVDGEMVGAPIIEEARRLLART